MRVLSKSALRTKHDRPGSSRLFRRPTGYFERFHPGARSDGVTHPTDSFTNRADHSAGGVTGTRERIIDVQKTSNTKLDLLHSLDR